MREYQKGDTLRKSIEKELSKIIRHLEKRKDGEKIVTERIWVKKIKDEYFEWGCR